MWKFKLNMKKISRIFAIILFFGMLILIYMISPRITTVIQDMANLYTKLIQITLLE